MKKTCWIGLIAMLSFVSTLNAAEKDTRVYEMRTYYAPPGKLDALHARFRNHTLKLFEKHGMVNIGYWVPLENPDNRLIYILAYPSREAREQSWKAFMADPDWQKAWKESERDGKLVAKAEHIFLTVTDYSPSIQVAQSSTPRVFELRTYTAAPGKLDALNTRFRDHTVKLFAKHGMTNVGYWNLMKDQKGNDDTLIYILAHKSKEGAAESFKGFREDPAWNSAKQASEASGPLTIPGGVKSLFMSAVDYSPMK